MIGHDVADTEFMQRVPGIDDIADLGHVGHRAACFEVRQDHLLMRLAEDVGAFRHEVNAAEEDELGFGARRGLLRELVRIAAKIGELDDFVALVVVTENHQSIAQLTAILPGHRLALILRHREVLARNLRLMLRSHTIATQEIVCAGALFRDATRLLFNNHRHCAHARDDQ